jgi:hypothetical protein
MTKISINLKDSFEVVDEGHSYNIPMYTVNASGLVETKNVNNIKFVRGSKMVSDNVEYKEGTVHEHLLSVMIHDLGLKNKLVPSEETTLAINHLQQAYNILLQRQIKRIKEGKLNTYKK